MNEQIPALAYIEAQILHQASAQGYLSSSVRSVENKYGLEEGSLGSGLFLETRILSLLYTLILVPKEFWRLDKNDQVYDRINKLWSLDKVEVKTDESKWQQPIYRFIHHLRNALAHANFCFSGGNFEFWDQYRNNPEQYRAVVSTNSMQEFLEVVGSRLANLKNEKRHSKATPVDARTSRG